MRRWVLAALVVALAAVPAIALAECMDCPAPKDVSCEVSVTIPEIMKLEYSGDRNLVFVLDESDLSRGYQVKNDHGNLNWWSNLRSWSVNVSRTPWSGGADMDLQVRHDVGMGSTDWHTVVIQPTKWITHEGKGYGMYGGIDWQVINFGDELEPGMYYTTVSLIMTKDF